MLAPRESNQSLAFVHTPVQRAAAYAGREFSLRAYSSGAPPAFQVTLRKYVRPTESNQDVS